MGVDMKQNLALLIDHLEEHEGQLIISYSNDNSKNREWVVGYKFGKEAEDSDMAGGATCGFGPSLAQALDMMTQDLH